MARKPKLSITLSPPIYERIARAARARKEPLSRLIEEAIVSWDRQRLEAELKEYYQEMAVEHGEFAEDSALLAGELVS